MKFDKLRMAYAGRMARADGLRSGKTKFVPKDQTVALLHAIIRSGDRVCLEGDNQKQADFLARELLKVDPRRINGLHMVQSSITLPEHIELFRRGIARRLDFAFSGPQAKALYEVVASRQAQVGAIHTYLELYGRYFLDLYPQVSLIAADACDARGNLFTGFNTEDTPTICEATRCKHGIVVAQVKRRMARLPRVDIPSDQVDFIVVTGEDYFIEPLFTRDPAAITDTQILMAMMTIKGIYAEYQVQAMNHGLGYATAAIELLLPTYGRELGLRGKCCTHWILNPHPTLIPAIEKGFVRQIYSFGGEPGMQEYVKARSDIFACGPDGAPRSNRCNAHIAGLYAIDLFCGATLQIDRFGNSSTAIKGMIAGFGGAPNLGGTPPGRRHMSAAFKKAGLACENVFHGRKLVVQITPTVSERKKIPVFVDELDASALAREGLFEVPPVMITGDQVTHIVTEQGVAYLHACPDLATRMQAVAAVAGDTPLGRSVNPATAAKLRRHGLLRTAGDLGIDPRRANRSMLAAQSLDDIVRISGGLYRIPASLRR
ncbi:MAG: malonate decarboxylase subunit alpha [bacterium]